MNQLLLALILSFLPISELRGGLPVAINYALKNNIPIFSVFLLVILANILVIVFAFFFLDFINKGLLKIPSYKRLFLNYSKHLEQKKKKLKKQIDRYGYIALAVFVGIPLPMTGAWSGCLIAWLLNLDRKKSYISIALGVLMAGIIVLLATLGIIGLFS